jgi:hypothetical protein
VLKATSRPRYTPELTYIKTKVNNNNPHIAFLVCGSTWRFLQIPSTGKCVNRKFKLLWVFVSGISSSELIQMFFDQVINCCIILQHITFCTFRAGLRKLNRKKIWRNLFLFCQLSFVSSAGPDDKKIRFRHKQSTQMWFGNRSSLWYAHLVKFWYNLVQGSRLINKNTQVGYCWCQWGVKRRAGIQKPIAAA